MICLYCNSEIKRNIFMSMHSYGCTSCNVDFVSMHNDQFIDYIDLPIQTNILLRFLLSQKMKSVYHAEPWINSALYLNNKEFIISQIYPFQPLPIIKSKILNLIPFLWHNSFAYIVTPISITLLPISPTAQIVMSIITSSIITLHYM